MSLVRINLLVYCTEISKNQLENGKIWVCPGNYVRSGKFTHQASHNFSAKNIRCLKSIRLNAFSARCIDN